MKRTVGILAGLATLAGGIYLGSQVWAQQGGAPVQRPPLQTRIALINLAQVVKKYQKYQQFEAGIKQQTVEIQKTIEGKKGQLVSYQKELEKPETPASTRDQYERGITQIQREVQDTMEEAKKRFAKLEYDELVKTYKEVRDAVDAYARAYAIELVLQYSDAEGSDVYLPAHFQHKITNRACIPMYIDPRMDITDGVTAMLNQKLATSTPAAPRTN